MLQRLTVYLFSLRVVGGRAEQMFLKASSARCYCWCMRLLIFLELWKAFSAFSTIPCQSLPLPTPSYRARAPDHMAPLAARLIT